MPQTTEQHGQHQINVMFDPQLELWTQGHPDTNTQQKRSDQDQTCKAARQKTNDQEDGDHGTVGKWIRPDSRPWGCRDNPEAIC